jgi:hypothetical protein
MKIKLLSATLTSCALLGLSMSSFANSIPACSTGLTPAALSLGKPIQCRLGKIDSSTYIGGTSINPGPVVVGDPSSYKQHIVHCTFTSNTNKQLNLQYGLVSIKSHTPSKTVNEKVSANSSQTVDSSAGFFFDPGMGIAINEVDTQPIKPDTYYNVTVQCQLEQ